jgi:hypothetical protein
VYLAFDHRISTMAESSPGSFLARITENFRPRANRTSGASFTGTGSPAPSSSSPLPPGVYLDTQTSEEREEILNTLSDVYFQKNGDCLDFELAGLPVAVTATELEAAAEDRTVALEAVSEKLSHHILRNYDAFAAGVQQVIGTEELLESAALQSKISRERLSVAAAEVQRGIGVWRNTQRKRGLTEVLDILLRLRRAREIAVQLSTALSEGDFCTALYFSEQLAEAAESLGPDLELANTLQIQACAGIEDSYSQIKVTVAALTSDFQPHAFDKILQGYALLASSSNFSIEIDPAGDVRAAFSAAPGAAAQKVLRGVLLARSGLEEKAAAADSLPALVALLPSDLFRTCLARVMMVFWDLLAAHHAMRKWHSNSNTSSSIPLMSGSGENNSTTENGTANGESTIKDTISNTNDASIALKDQIEVVYASISSGLSSSSRVLWDECSRAIGTLLSTPAAVESEHFMQVITWTHHLIEAGESFSGVEATALRAVLHRQAGAYFKSYHESNIEALNSMLNKEMWKRLPISELPPLLASDSTTLVGATAAGGGSQGRDQAALPSNGGGGSGDGGVSSPLSTFSSSLPEFDTLVLKGNPWYTTRSFLETSLSIDMPTNDSPADGADGDGADDSTNIELFNSDSNDGDGIPLKNLSLANTKKNPTTNSTTTPSLSTKQEDTVTVTVTVTNSSWRMAKWMRDYVSLMHTLPNISISIFNGLTELLDLYLLHIYLDFGDGALLLGSGSGGGGGGGGAVNDSSSAKYSDTSSSLVGGGSEYLTPRLRTTLQHIALGSLSKHRAVLTAGSGSTHNNSNTRSKCGGSKLARALAPHSTENMTSTSSRPSSSGAAVPHNPSSPDSSPAEMKTSSSQHLAMKPATASPSATTTTTTTTGSQASSIAHSGNLYGLLERHTAGESLISICQHISNAETAFFLEKSLPSDEKISVSMYCDRILGASYDLYDSVMIHGCRLMLPLYWIPDAVGSAGSSEYQAAEPPAEAAPWTRQLTRQLELFGAQVNQAEGMMTTSDTPATSTYQTPTPTTGTSMGTQPPSPPSAAKISTEMWQHATKLLTDALLEGFSRVKKCTLEGRSAMSADLQAVRHALPRAYWDVLRKADDYVKAFYVPLPELASWAEQHPGYSEAHVMALAHCIGESSGLKKKDLQAAMAQVEAGLHQNKLKKSGGSGGGNIAVY